MNRPRRCPGWLALIPAMTLALGVTAPARAVAATGCPPPPTTVAGLLAVERRQDGRLNPFRPVACYGHRTLAPRGCVVATEGLGGTSNVSTEPTWLDGWHFIGYALQPTSAHDVGGHRCGTGPYFFVASSSGWATHSLARHVDRWVIVRGHFDDPAARTCHAARVWSGPTTIPPRSEVVRRCREVFVLTSIASATTTPTTDSAADAIDPASPGEQSPAPPAILGGCGLGLGLGLLALRRRRA